jgi:hypothetical protein
MTEESYIVLVQIGYQKSVGRRPGQLVRAYLQFKTGSEEEIQRGTGEDAGRWLTDFADSKSGRAWYMAKVSVSDGDSIRFEIFTGYQGKGEDTSLTQKRIYVVDSSAPVRDIELSHVGYHRYPLAKGRLLEVDAVTKREETDREIEAFLDDETGM